MIQCSRCGISLRTNAASCPSCSAALQRSEDMTKQEDYYAMFDLSPHLSCRDISARLRETARIWTFRANNAPQIEQRHEAERMLHILAEAEAVLLDPVKRRVYDATRNGQTTAGGSASSSRAKSRQQSQVEACPRCGLRQTVAARHCPACGYQLADASVCEDNGTETPMGAQQNDPSTASQESSPSSPFPASPGREQRTYSTEPTNRRSERSLNLPGLFGWCRLQGTVIAVEAVYMARQEFDWLRVLSKLALGLLFLPLLIGFAVAALIVGMSFTLLGIGASGFFSSLASHLLGFFLIGRLHGPKEQTPVRDIRLRDDAHQEHLVRFRGELVMGNVNVGDEIKVAGFNRRGTLMFRRGVNRRTRSEIRVKRR